MRIVHAQFTKTTGSRHGSFIMQRISFRIRIDKRTNNGPNHSQWVCICISVWKPLYANRIAIVIKLDVFGLADGWNLLHCMVCLLPEKNAPSKNYIVQKEWKNRAIFSAIQIKYQMKTTHQRHRPFPIQFTAVE